MYTIDYDSEKYLIELVPYIDIDIDITGNNH